MLFIVRGPFLPLRKEFLVHSRSKSFYFHVISKYCLNTVINYWKNLRVVTNSGDCASPEGEACRVGDDAEEVAGLLENADSSFGVDGSSSEEELGEYSNGGEPSHNLFSIVNNDLNASMH